MNASKETRHGVYHFVAIRATDFHRTRSTASETTWEDRVNKRPTRGTMNWIRFKFTSLTNRIWPLATKPFNDPTKSKDTTYCFRPSFRIQFRRSCVRFYNGRTVWTCTISKMKEKPAKVWECTMEQKRRKKQWKKSLIKSHRTGAQLFLLPIVPFKRWQTTNEKTPISHLLDGGDVWFRGEKWSNKIYYS